LLPFAVPSATLPVLNLGPTPNVRLEAVTRETTYNYQDIALPVRLR